MAISIQSFKTIYVYVKNTLIPEIIDECMKDIGIERSKLEEMKQFS